MIIGVSGKAGSGKDTVARLLKEKFDFEKLSFADPLKQIAKDVFDFTDQQLWGPSEYRNAPDFRYPRTERARELAKLAQREADDGEELAVIAKEMKFTQEDFLTPREALQLLGTEWGRRCYPNIWVDLAIRKARKMLEEVTDGVVIPDVRFANEIQLLRKAGGILVRIKRPDAGLQGAAASHVSETGMDGIPDIDFDYVIANDGTLADLEEAVCDMMRLIRVRRTIARVKELQR